MNVVKVENVYLGFDAIIAYINIIGNAVARNHMSVIHQNHYGSKHNTDNQQY